jgi:hypothetical protein
MKFRLYREYGALNSKEIFNAFEHGLSSLGLSTTPNNDGIPVIWSVLWHGRMSNNRNIYHNSIKMNQPVIIIEVGNLIRGKSWRISLNHVNQQGIFGNNINIDYKRHQKLNLSLKPFNNNRNPAILIAAQHERSLQWEGQPHMSGWVLTTIEKIKQNTDRPIVVRPHPRSPFSFSYPNIKVLTPQRIPNTYDSFDIDYQFHSVVNYNSGPGVQAAIEGIPVVVNDTSLAAPVSDVLTNIENPQLPDRTEWFAKLCHTEWTQEEISQGIPMKRILPEIERQLS